MVQGAIFANGKSQLAILEGNQTAESYIRTLNDFLLPLISEGRRGTIVYQQDNATIHKAHITKMWLLYQNIQTIDWPAHSPDLNPIENVWVLLERRVYANGRVFSTIDEQRSCILGEWQNSETETIRNLITSMPQRCLPILNNKGHCIWSTGGCFCFLVKGALKAFRTLKLYRWK